MADVMKTVEDFLASFGTLDVDRIMSFFAPEAVYHNMPMAPMRGEKAIRGVIEYFVKPAQKIEFVILNIMAAGNVVLNERLDKFLIGEKNVELPVMGTFEVEDGKIVVWRDYFDMATWQKQTG